MFLIMGIAGVALVAYWSYTLQAQSRAVLNEIVHSGSPTTTAIRQMIDQTRFNMGFALGFALAAGWACACGLVVAGFVGLVTRNRRDELLLKCRDAGPPR